MENGHSMKMENAPMCSSILNSTARNLPTDIRVFKALPTGMSVVSDSRTDMSTHWEETGEAVGHLRGVLCSC